jgi:hypothetical protein
MVMVQKADAAESQPVVQIQRIDVHGNAPLYVQIVSRMLLTDISPWEIYP